MINQLEIRHFQYFLMLAETLHYRKAAERLFISQSALSQQIARLETITGQKLFIRTNRKVNLSQAGILFQKEAELMINQLNQSIERWQLGIKGGDGILRIGFVGSAMQVYLPPIIKQFAAECPRIKFYLQDLSNKDQLKFLEKKQLDIGFVRAKNLPATMESISVFTENFSLVLPENHAITAENFVDMSQLADESYILFPNERSHMYYQQIINLCGDYGFQPHLSHQSIHGPTIFKLVESGLGISIVPNSLRDEYNYKIRFIELDNIPQKTELFAVWNKGNDNAALPYFLPLLK